jgi:hypothetical protein
MENVLDKNYRENCSMHFICNTNFSTILTIFETFKQGFLTYTSVSAPCAVLKVSRRFGEAPLSPSSRVGIRSQGRFSWRHVPPKSRLNFIGLCDAISRKIKLFITNAVRTSNPIFSKLYIKNQKLYFEITRPNIQFLFSKHA